ncbi:MAG: hypothetical protein ACOYUB_01275 [Patescibacteria group bacterium]
MKDKVISFFKKNFQFLSTTDLFFVFIIAALFFGIILSNHITRKGDGVEYMMTTEALFFDKSLTFTDNVLQRHRALKPSSIDNGGYSVNPGRDSKYYLTQHPLYYSALTVPLYGLLHFIHPKVAYYSFYLINFLFLLATVLVLIYFFKKIFKYGNYLFLVFAYFFFSTVIPYMLWPHPETLIFSCVTLFFFFLYGLRRPILSSVFLGVAVGQSLVLIFLTLNLVYHLLFIERKSRWFKIVASGIMFSTIASFHYLVSYAYTGNFFSLVYNSTLSFIALKDVVYAVFDPAVGLIWFYPMVVFSLFFSKKEIKTLIVIGSAFLSLLFYMVNLQFYTHQVGLRYLNYIYPAFFFILDVEKIKKNLLLVMVFVGISGMLTAGIITDLTSSNASMDPTTKNFIGYRLLSKALFPYYKEHPNVFIYHSTRLENHLPYVNELGAFKIYASNDGGNLYPATGWVLNNQWTRFMLNNVRPGTLRIILDTDCGRTDYIVSNRSYFTSSKEIMINLDASNIGHAAKRDMDTIFNDFFYFDLKAEPSCQVRGIKQININDFAVYLHLL